jgi:hypothetical protein
MLKSTVVDCDLLTSFWTFLKRQISRKTAKAKALLFKELGKTGKHYHMCDVRVLPCGNLSIFAI